MPITLVDLSPGVNRPSTIQANTVDAVNAIEHITTVISRISEFQTTIASAVEEQTATTSEVTRNVSNAAWAPRTSARTAVRCRAVPRASTLGCDGDHADC